MPHWYWYWLRLFGEKRVVVVVVVVVVVRAPVTFRTFSETFPGNFIVFGHFPDIVIGHAVAVAAIRLQVHNVFQQRYNWMSTGLNPSHTMVTIRSAAAAAAAAAAAGPYVHLPETIPKQPFPNHPKIS